MVTAAVGVGVRLLIACLLGSLPVRAGTTVRSRGRRLAPATAALVFHAQPLRRSRSPQAALQPQQQQQQQPLQLPAWS